jgi:hypothetical protein
MRLTKDFRLPRGRHLSYQRGKRNTTPGTSLIKIEGVDDPKAARYEQSVYGLDHSSNGLPLQLLPRKEDRICLPRQEGSSRVKHSRDLGKGDTSTRYGFKRYSIVT